MRFRRRLPQPAHTLTRRSSPPKAPDWVQPPEGSIGQATGINLQLVDQDRAKLSLDYISAHEVGVVLHFVYVSQRKGFQNRAWTRINNADEDSIVVSLELPDGTTAKTSDDRKRDPSTWPDSPRSPSLVGHQSSGMSQAEGWTSGQFSLWLWPRPAPGTITVKVDWKATKETGSGTFDFA